MRHGVFETQRSISSPGGDHSKAIMREKQKLAEEKKATPTLEVFLSEFHVSMNIPVIHTVTSTAADIHPKHAAGEGRGSFAEGIISRKCAAEEVYTSGFHVQVSSKNRIKSRPQKQKS